jgi:signal transduction histidine kinase
MPDTLDVSHEWAHHQITLDKALDSPVWVLADEGQLQMVVLNLLKNAIDVLRSLPLPRQVHVRLAFSGNDAALTVSDNGPGIPQSQMAQVFDMFYSTKEDGMGLGLWLSHAIMQKHDGQLKVSQSPMGGACFTMTLPSPHCGAKAPASNDPVGGFSPGRSLRQSSQRRS